MFSYSEQAQMLEPVKLREGESKRINCPFCGGNKTLSMSRYAGARRWNCFKASCDARGIESAPMTAEAMHRLLTLPEEPQEPERKTPPIPDHLSDVRHHKRAMAYLKTVGCDRYLDRVQIRYAPAEDRVLFFYAEGQGAVGRSLRGDKPKWRVYGNGETLVTFGEGDVAVAVEDAPSAVAVGGVSVFKGCALLGTSISSAQKRALAQHREVIIALDKDASRKALKLARKLEDRVKTRIVLLEEDLKYLPPDEIEKVLS